MKGRGRKETDSTQMQAFRFVDKGDIELFSTAGAGRGMPQVYLEEHLILQASETMAF